MRHQSLSAADDGFGAVVHAQVSGGAPLGDEALDGGDDAVGVDAVGGLDAEDLSGELVDDVEQLDAAQARGLVELEIQGPHVVGALGAQPSGGAVGEAAALGFALRRALQALVAPDAPCALGVGHQALAVRHDMGLAPPQPWMAASEVPQMLTQAGLSIIGGRLGPALSAAVLAQHRARPTLRDPEPLLDALHRDPPTVRGHHFPSANSLSIALSSSASANSFFSRPFSTSSSLSRLA